MASPTPRIDAHKTPTAYRSLVAAAALACIHCAGSVPRMPTVSTGPVSVAKAQPAIDGAELAEADVIRLAMAQDPHAIAARHEAAVAAAQGVGVGLYPNPTVAWDREHLPSDPSESEDSLSVTVPVDLSPRRAARRHLAVADVSAARARALRTQSDVVVRALDVFYRLIAAQHRVGIQNRAVDRLQEAVRIVGRRKQEGNASGYDQTRIEIEAQLSESELIDSRIEVELLRGELALLLGLDESAIVAAGVLEPSQDLGGTAAGAAKASTESLRALRAAEDQTRAANDAAQRAWIPSLGVSLGLRLADSGETRYGYVAGVSVGVPLFSRGQGLRAEAQARDGLARARVRAAERGVELATRRAERTLAAAKAELARFDEATKDRVERLERAAESGYREGDRTIVELLDARRARTEVETRRLGLALSVKRAEVALRAATGSFE